jgi:hypothetical protein
MPATCKSCRFLNLSTHNQTFKGNFWFSFLCVFLVLLKRIKTLRSNMITGCHPCGDCLVMPRLSLSLFSLPLSFRRAHAQIPNLQLHRHPQTGRRVESFCSWEKVPLFWHGAPLAHGFSLFLEVLDYLLPAHAQRSRKATWLMWKAFSDSSASWVPTADCSSFGFLI